MNYHIGRLVLSSLCFGDLVRLVLSGARFAGFSLQNPLIAECSYVAIELLVLSVRLGIALTHPSTHLIHFTAKGRP